MPHSGIQAVRSQKSPRPGPHWCQDDLLLRSCACSHGNCAAVRLAASGSTSSQSAATRDANSSLHRLLLLTSVTLSPVSSQASVDAISSCIHATPEATGALPVIISPSTQLHNHLSKFDDHERAVALHHQASGARPCERVIGQLVLHLSPLPNSIFSMLCHMQHGLFCFVFGCLLCLKQDFFNTSLCCVTTRLVRQIQFPGPCRASCRPVSSRVLTNPLYPPTPASDPIPTSGRV